MAVVQAARELLDFEGENRIVLPLDGRGWLVIEPCFAPESAPERPSTPGPSGAFETPDLASGKCLRDGVDVHDECSVKHWMERLDVTREDLVAAVGKVGGAATDLCAYFARHRKHW